LPAIGGEDGCIEALVSELSQVSEIKKVLLIGLLFARRNAFPLADKILRRE
jgi:hypothetical protein